MHVDARLALNKLWDHGGQHGQEGEEGEDGKEEDRQEEEEIGLAATPPLPETLKAWVLAVARLISPLFDVV